MGKKCEICGRDESDDLFMSVAQEPVCSVCIADLGGLIPTKAGVKNIRAKLGLAEGEYYERSSEETAKTIRSFLGRL